MQVIEFLDPEGDIIVTRRPAEGSGEFVLGDQLVVQETQVGVFFRDGRALDGFRAGRHTLATENLPLLKDSLGAGFRGKSPFRAYVYFVSTKTFTGLGWGTASPVTFRDTDLRMVSLRAYGSYSIRITKPRTFLDTIVGTRGVQSTFDVQNFLRTIIVSRLNETIGRQLKSILDLPTEYSNIAALVKQATAEDFGQYGIQLVDLLVESITPPPEVQEMINRATGVAAQDVEKYKSIATADALRDAARNPGSAGEGLGLGAGLGMGIAMAKTVSDQLSQTSPTPPASPPSSPSPTQPLAPAPQPLASPPSPADLRSKLTELKKLFDDGLITEAEYAAQRKEYLDRL